MLPVQKLLPAVIFIIACTFPFTNTNAQITIRGTVYNQRDGSAAAFVTVKEKGKKNAVASDIDGKFSITINRLPARLQFSAAGFDNTEVLVTDSLTKLIIKIAQSSKHLEEVVVTGYGTEKDDYDYTASAATERSKAVMYNKYSRGKTSGTFRSVAGKPRKSALAAGDVAAKGLPDRAPLTYEHDAMTSSVYDSLMISKEEKPIKRTSLLTAGEVNDFKKWKMWEDYNETDFKTYSSKWSLYATKRYTVQLINNNRMAVVGETVYLVNKDTKEIIWTGISDNTGKAELWNGFSNNSKENNLAIEIKGEHQQFAAIPFSQGINHIRLNRDCSFSNKAEIAFVVDATGSMGDEIEYLKEELGDILTKFSTKDPSLDLRTGAVFYRDSGDEYLTRVQPFSNNISSTINFIKEQTANGGGDYPEALKEALEQATEKLEWSETARTKIIFLLMDAPPHDEARNKMASIIAKAASKGIRIVPVACSGTDKATEFIMRSMALATNGTYLFLTDDSGIGNPHIKPTTDEFKVELLNDLLQRIMEQMCFVSPCTGKTKDEEPLTNYINSEKIKLFPNPTSGPVTIETDKELKEIFVADFTGKILMRTEVKDQKKQYQVNLTQFPAATYFIRYITKENKTGAEKIVLVR